MLEDNSSGTAGMADRSKVSSLAKSQVRHYCSYENKRNSVVCFWQNKTIL